MAQGHSVSQWFILGFSFKTDISQIGWSPSDHVQSHEHKAVQGCKL